MDYQEAPTRLRRLTVEEASILQTFPLEYVFCGSQSSKFKQIGNAVPCNLASTIARMMMDCMLNDEIDNIIKNLQYQLEIESF